MKKFSLLLALVLSVLLLISIAPVRSQEDGEYDVDQTGFDDNVDNASYYNSYDNPEATEGFVDNADIDAEAESNFDVDAAKSVAQIRRDIGAIVTRRAQPRSIGWCAKYTREAINMAGVPTGRTGSAKNYGPILTRAGFKVVANRNYQVGDVQVIQSPSSASPHG